MLDWSQERLAKNADVGLSSVRGLEAQRRGIDSTVSEAIWRTLASAGVLFIEGDATGGPGVRLAPQRVNLLRRPTTVTAWDGVPFDVEVQGRALKAFITREALEDIGRVPSASKAELLVLFEKHTPAILVAAERAAVERESYDRDGRLHVSEKDLIPAEQRHAARLQPPEGAAMVFLRPIPKRIWRGELQEQRDDLWSIHEFDRKEIRLTVCNTVTGHYLPLKPAHVQNFSADAPSGGPDAGRWCLNLSVQPVFEDGFLRLDQVAGDA